MSDQNDSMMNEMIRLQNDFNKVVNPDWVRANYPFNEAVMVEVGEAFEHFGYKWWKAQTTDLKQVYIEMVDVWHFGLSMIIIGKTKADEQGFRAYMRKVVHAATADEPWFDIVNFKLACESIGLTYEDLYKLYIMKNVLNNFRQANGYKIGTYIKDWGGEFKEDNIYLEHLWTIRNDWTFDELYSELQLKYKEVSSKTIEGYEIV